MNHIKDITVIIATTAEKKRESQLYRAIESVLSQTNCCFELLLIINGERFDGELKQRLEKDSRFICSYKKEGSYPKAAIYARSIIKTPYFCFLDDDDELLNNSLALKLEEFKLFPDTDVVVGNGFKNMYQRNTLECHPNILCYQDNPLEQLLEPNGNWLASCAALFKTQSIGQVYFDDYSDYSEWTYLAFKLALNTKIRFIKKYCHRINMQNDSLSHTKDYLLGIYSLQYKILELPLPEYVRKKVLYRIMDIEHSISEYFLVKRDIKKAWFYHLKSISTIEGFLKYFLFTRKLF